MSTLTLRFCLGCGHWLPVGDYYPRSDRPGELYPRCIACMKAQSMWSPLRKRAAAGSKPHYTQDRGADTAVCRQCGERKPMDDFAPGRRGRGNGWVCRPCQRLHWQRDNERRRRLRQQRKAPPIVVEVELPPGGHYDDLVMAGGIILRRQPQQHARVPGGVLYVDIWQGTDPATGQLVQGWRWAMYYDW